MNKVLLLSLTVVLGLGVLFLGWTLVRQIMDPLDFQKETKIREAAVIERIKDIRSAEQFFKQKNGKYTGDMDSLIDFVLTENLEYERRLGDKDDSIAVKKGLVVEKFTIPMRDTIFSPRVLSTDDIRNLRFIPYAAPGTEFILNATMLTTESGVVVPVFEAKAPYKTFLADLDRQELVNLIDNAQNVFNKYPGITVGSIERTTNDAGNWE